MPAFVRQNATGTASPYTITAAAAGNVLIFYFADFRSAAARTISSLSCTNVTWTKLGSTTNGSVDTEIWFGVVAGGSSGTSITVTMSGSGSTQVMTAIEFSGVLVAGTIHDGAGVTNTGTSTSPSIGSFSCSTGGELAVCCAGYANGTAPTGLPGGIWTNGTFANNSTTVGVQPQYALRSPQGSVSASWTITSAAWVTVVGALFQVPLNWLPSHPDRIFDKVSVVPY